MALPVSARTLRCGARAAERSPRIQKDTPVHSLWALLTLPERTGAAGALTPLAVLQAGKDTRKVNKTCCRCYPNAHWGN